MADLSKLSRLPSAERLTGDKTAAEPTYLNKAFYILFQWHSIVKWITDNVQNILLLSFFYYADSFLPKDRFDIFGHSILRSYRYFLLLYKLVAHLSAYLDIVVIDWCFSSNFVSLSVDGCSFFVMHESSKLEMRVNLFKLDWIMLEDIERHELSIGDNRLSQYMLILLVNIICYYFKI